MRRIVWTARAARDLSGIRDRIADNDPRAADKVRERIEGFARWLEAHPRLGRRTGAVRRRAVIPGLPYLVYYQIEPDRISVVHIRHGARRRASFG